MSGPPAAWVDIHRGARVSCCLGDGGIFTGASGPPADWERRDIHRGVRASCCLGEGGIVTGASGPPAAWGNIRMGVRASHSLDEEGHSQGRLGSSA